MAPGEMAAGEEASSQRDNRFFLGGTWQAGIGGGGIDQAQQWRRVIFFSPPCPLPRRPHHSPRVSLPRGLTGGCPMDGVEEEQPLVGMVDLRTGGRAGVAQRWKRMRAEWDHGGGEREYRPGAEVGIRRHLRAHYAVPWRNTSHFLRWYRRVGERVEIDPSAEMAKESDARREHSLGGGVETAEQGSEQVVAAVEVCVRVLGRGRGASRCRRMG
jgi:hypothetical protein